MAEEVRFFLRTALYSAGIAAIYWLLSRDPPGTVMLAAIALAGGFLVATMIGHAPATLRGMAAPGGARRPPDAPSAERERERGRVERVERHDEVEADFSAHRPSSAPARALDALNRVLGLAEDRDITAGDPLAGGPDRFPTGSLWPLLGGAAALLVGMGLVYGAWLLLPGVGLGVGTAIGWIAQETRRA